MGSHQNLVHAMRQASCQQPHEGISGAEEAGHMMARPPERPAARWRAIGHAAQRSTAARVAG